jgi:hypothetical protein
MKNRNPLCAAAILSLALSIPAFAGDIQTPTVTTPPPPPFSSNGGSDLTVPADTGVQQPTEFSSQDLLVSLFVDWLTSF